MTDNSANAPPGRLIVVSGPSGAGKSTVVRELFALARAGSCPLPLAFSVSATTRAPRPGEQDGVDYYFLSPEEFARRREARAFLECKQYAGNWYGTLQREVSAGLAAGKWVILEIDVEGTFAVLDQHPDALTIFIHSGSVEELERRLKLRNTESPEALERRLAAARRELAQMDRYRHKVINRDVPEAVREVCEILLRHAQESPCSTH
jgi:guanylate kinase